MELRNSITIPERKGCNAIVTITPRKVVAEDHQVTYSTSTEPSDEVSEAYNNPSNEEADNEPRFNKLLQVKQELQKKLESHHHDDGKDKPTVVESGMLRKWIYFKSIPSKAVFKWMIIVLNVVIESTQAVYSQNAATGVISKTNYGKMSPITASMCLIISITDIMFEVWEGDVKWRKRGFCPWFFYPGKHGRAFGSFWLVFGLVSSMAQLWLTLVAFLTNGSGPIRFDYWPLLLSVCFFLAAFGGDRKSMKVVVKCDIKHGEYEIEGRFVRGSWFFACPSCETAIRSV